VAYKLEQEIALWDPTAKEESTTDPFKTLFVGRINYYTSESKIKREFESYGPIKQIKMAVDKVTGKPKGYCFIEYEHERDMHCKYDFIWAMTFSLITVSLSAKRIISNPSSSFRGLVG